MAPIVGLLAGAAAALVLAITKRPRGGTDAAAAAAPGRVSAGETSYPAADTAAASEEPEYADADAADAEAGGAADEAGGADAEFAELDEDDDDV